MFLRWILAGYLALTCVACAAAGGDTRDAPPLRVALDDSYPPYVFREADGKLDGFLVELWRLWEARTGVRVELKATDWAEAQQAMVLGRADVIDTFFRTPEREAGYDFTAPYADLPVGIYVHKSIGGVHDTDSLRSFLVGVKDGDACAEFLTRKGIDTLQRLPGYVSVIEAAGKMDTKIFCLDDPPAQHLLYQRGLHKEFYRAFELYRGQFHRAVRKGDAATLALVNRGFASIPPEELQALQDKWLGSPLTAPAYDERLGYFIAALVGASVLLLWVAVLRRQVRLRTLDLEREHARLHSVIRTIPDLVWLKDPDGVYLSCNPRFEAFFGASEAEILGKTDADFVDKEQAAFFRQRDVDAISAGGPVTDEEWVTFASDGRRVLLETIKTIVRDAHGRVTGVLGVGRDITARAAAEQALRESEERYRIAFRTSPDAVNINRLTDGRYIDVNEGFVRITGWTREEAVGESSLELGIWARPEERQELVRRLNATGVCEGFRMHFRRKDGSIGVGMMSARITKIDGEDALLSISRDISGQIESEHALLDAQRIARLGSYRFLIRTAEWTDSPVMSDIFGIDETYPRTMEGWVALIHPDDRAEMAAYVQGPVLTLGEPFDREYRIVRPVDGAVRWMHGLGQVSFDGAGQPVVLAGTIQDVTAQKEIEQALRISEERLRMAQDAAGVAIWDVDVATGDTHWSPGIEALYGLPAGTFGNRFDSWLQYVATEDQERVRAELRGFRKGQWSHEFEYRIRHASGEIRWLLARGGSILGADGKVSRALGINMDITERKTAADELARYRNHLEELVAERTADLAQARDAAEAANRAKSAFLANMSHEIRTPMNGILGMAQMVRREGVTPLQSERLDKLDHAAQHLLRVINDILDLSRIEAGKFTLDLSDFDLAALVEETVQMVQHRVQAKGLTVVVDCGVSPWLVRGDALRIKQALLNYLTNAVKFSEHGTIRVIVTQHEETDQGRLVRFTVEDQGIGVPEDAMPRLFRSFEQADNSTTRRYGGTGLGLAITRRLAQIMGGDSGASSTLGRGSRFWFTVRLGMASASQLPPRQDALRDAERQLMSTCAGKRVLVVDDDPFSRGVMQLLLETYGLDVDVAEDGIDAIEHFLACPSELVLMDVQMPRLDGLDATLRIRQMPGGEDVPIIAVTANVFLEDRAACFAAGMNDFIAKPVQPEALSRSLLEWLSRGAEHSLQGVEN